MTQQQLIIEYCKEFGGILPAKLYGEVYRGQMLGSELSKRCRELRAKGILKSMPVGKFEKFYLSDQPPQTSTLSEAGKLLQEWRARQVSKIERKTAIQF